jgi:hypothetical protein
MHDTNKTLTIDKTLTRHLSITRDLNMVFMIELFHDT